MLRFLKKMPRPTYKLRQATLNGKHLVFSYDQATKNYKDSKLYLFVFSIAFVFFLVDYLQFSSIMPQLVRLLVFIGVCFSYFAVNLLLVFLYMPIGNRFPNFYLPTFVIPIPCVFVVSWLLYFCADYYSNGSYEWDQPFWRVTLVHYAIILIFEAFVFEYLLAPTAEKPQKVRPSSKPEQIQEQKIVKIGSTAFATMDILHIKSIDHYLEVTTSRQTTTVQAALKTAVQLLSPDAGKKINRSVWVSYAAIHKIQTVNGITTLTTTDKKSFRVSASITAQSLRSAVTRVKTEEVAEIRTSC